MSLRKLHDKNPHHLKVRKAYKLSRKFTLANDCDLNPSPQTQTHHQDAHTTTKQQKEIIEVLPLPDSREQSTSTVSSIKADQSTLRSSKNDVSGSDNDLNEQTHSSGVGSISLTKLLISRCDVISHFVRFAQISLTPANILRHLNGKYSAYDMAQYVFWTGDEEGVAKAVEELIDNGLMSRESALEFLSEIRTGMEYLEGTYNFNSDDTKDVCCDKTRILLFR